LAGCLEPRCRCPGPPCEHGCVGGCAPESATRASHPLMGLLDAYQRITARLVCESLALVGVAGRDPGWHLHRVVVASPYAGYPPEPPGRWRPHRASRIGLPES